MIDLDQVDTSRVSNTASVVVNVNGANVGMLEMADVVAPNPGDPVLYTVVVTNRVPLKANNITRTDQLPGGHFVLDPRTNQAVFRIISPEIAPSKGRPASWCSISLLLA